MSIKLLLPLIFGNLYCNSVKTVAVKSLQKKQEMKKETAQNYGFSPPPPSWTISVIMKIILLNPFPQQV